MVGRKAAKSGKKRVAIASDLKKVTSKKMKRLRQRMPDNQVNLSSMTKTTVLKMEAHTKNVAVAEKNIHGLNDTNADISFGKLTFKEILLKLNDGLELNRLFGARMLYQLVVNSPNEIMNIVDSILQELAPRIIDTDFGIRKYAREILAEVAPYAINHRLIYKNLRLSLTSVRWNIVTEGVNLVYRLMSIMPPRFISTYFIDNILPLVLALLKNGLTTTEKIPGVCNKVGGIFSDLSYEAVSILIQSVNTIVSGDASDNQSYSFDEALQLFNSNFSLFPRNAAVEISRGNQGALSKKKHKAHAKQMKNDFVNVQASDSRIAARDIIEFVDKLIFQGGQKELESSLCISACLLNLVVTIGHCTVCSRKNILTKVHPGINNTPLIAALTRVIYGEHQPADLFQQFGLLSTINMLLGICFSNNCSDMVISRLCHLAYHTLILLEEIGGLRNVVVGSLTKLARILSSNSLTDRSDEFEEVIPLRIFTADAMIILVSGLKPNLQLDTIPRFTLCPMFHKVLISRGEGFGNISNSSFDGIDSAHTNPFEALADY